MKYLSITSSLISSLLIVLLMSTTAFGRGRRSYTPPYIEDCDQVSDDMLNYFIASYDTPPVARVVDINHIEDFNSTTTSTGDTWWTSNTTLAVDSSNVLCGPNSLKVTLETGTNNGGTYSHPSFDPNINLSNTQAMVRFYIHKGSSDANSWHTIEKLTLQLKDPDADSLYYDLWNGSGTDWVDVTYGWHTKAVNLSNTASGSAAIGNFDFANVNKLRVNILKQAYGGVAENDTTPSVTFDELMFWPERTKAAVMIRLDDGTDSQLGMLNQCTARGLRASIGIIGSKVGTSGYLTVTQLQNLQAAGHLIVNHSWTEDQFTTLTDTQIVNYVERMQEWMCDNGFARGARILIAPGGMWPAGTTELLKDKLDFVWLSKDMGEAYGVHSDYNRWRIAAYNQSEGNISTMNSLLQDAIDYGGIWCPYWHGDNAKFDSHLDQIKSDYAAGNIDVITPAEFIRE